MHKTNQDELILILIQLSDLAFHQGEIPSAKKGYQFAMSFLYQSQEAEW